MKNEIMGISERDLRSDREYSCRALGSPYSSRIRMTTSMMTVIMSSVFVRSILFTVFSEGVSIFSPS